MYHYVLKMNLKLIIKEFDYLWNKTLLLNKDLINAYKIRL